MIVNNKLICVSSNDIVCQVTISPGTWNTLHVTNYGQCHSFVDVLINLAQTSHISQLIYPEDPDLSLSSQIPSQLSRKFNIHVQSRSIFSSDRDFSKGITSCSNFLLVRE